MLVPEGWAPIGDALHISRPSDLALLEQGAPLPDGVALLVHDIPGETPPLGMAAIGFGIDPVAMEPISESLRPRAAELAARLMPLLGTLPPLAGHALSVETVMTLAIDTVSTPLRRTRQLVLTCAAAGAKRLRLAHPDALTAGAARYLAASGLDLAAWGGGSLTPPRPRLQPRGALPAPPTHGLDTALPPLEEPADLYVTSTVRNLYDLSIMPVLRRTLARRRALLLLAGPHDAAAFAAEHGVAAELAQGRLVVRAPALAQDGTRPLGDPAGLAAIAACLAAFAEEPDTAEGAGLRLILAEGAARRVMSRLHHAATLQEEARPIISRIASVTASPGRLAMAMALIDLANAHGIATHEVQAGPISARRAVPPQTRTIFCMDAISAETYRDALGVAPERVQITGSPRVQALLAPWLRITRARARTLLRRHVPLDRPRLLLLATQPIGPAACGRLLATTLAARRGMDDVQLLVRPHPSEDAAYRTTYAAMLEGEDAARVTETDSDPYLLLRACDWLVTYTSTLGHEAAMLGVPVFTLNPFEEPPAYDLAAGGMATHAADATALAALLAAPPPRRKPRAAVDSAGLIANAILGAQESPA